MARKETPEQSRVMARAVGRVIRKRRLALGLSQEQFAERLGIHRTQVGFLERGENTTTIYTLAVVAKAFDCAASDLLRDAGF